MAYLDANAINICRICHKWQGGPKIKYSTRHYAHLACIRLYQKADLLKTQTRWQLEMLLREHGEEVTRLGLRPGIEALLREHEAQAAEMRAKI